MVFFFFKQKTAYEVRISDWSSDVCSSDLLSSFSPGLNETAAKQLPVATEPVRRQCFFSTWPIRFMGRSNDPERSAAQHHGKQATATTTIDEEIGRAPCRESGCRYVWIVGVAASLKKTTKSKN